MESVRNKYTGRAAAEYESQRTGSDKWRNEHDAVELLLRKATSVDSINTVIDVPIGTGRFTPIYSELSLSVTGIDVSQDMLSETKKKRSLLGDDLTLIQDNLLSLDPDAPTADVVVCIRLLNWFTFEEVKQALESVQTLNTKFAIMGVRTKPETDESFLKRVWIKSYEIGNRILSHDLLSDKLSITIHDEQDWMDALDETGLAIENRVLISSDVNRGRYYIYLLRKKV